MGLVVSGGVFVGVGRRPGGSEHDPARPQAEVGPKDDAPGVAAKQRPEPGRVVPAELDDAGGEVHVQVRISVEPLRHRPRIFRVVPEMHRDEHRLRMAGDQPLVLAEQLRERGDLGIAVVAPRRVRRELLPALVFGARRLEERLRVAGVDDHGQTEAAGGPPHRVERGGVHRPASAAGADHAEPERLFDLEGPGPLRRRRLEQRDRRLREPRVPGRPPGQIRGEHHPAALSGRRPLPLEDPARPPAG